jgi:hypothetical protein
MSLKLLVLVGTGILLYNTYYETSIFHSLLNYKKEGKMALIALTGLGLYIMISRNPLQGLATMKILRQFVNVMPVDRATKEVIRFGTNQAATPSPYTSNAPAHSVERIQQSGKTSSKRSVSETKKKHVASLQNWRCKRCNQQLTAWFEVDHTIRLDQGGTNDVQNLVALCRNCHGEKTAMENI